jgi:hypothetical protein
MIHYPHPHNEQHHNDNINHWWAYETNRYLQDRLRNLVLRANWNKRIICRIKLTNDKQLKSVAMQYNEQRMKQLKTIFTIIRNYEN